MTTNIVTTVVITAKQMEKYVKRSLISSLSRIVMELGSEVPASICVKFCPESVIVMLFLISSFCWSSKLTIIGVNKNPMAIPSW